MIIQLKKDIIQDDEQRILDLLEDLEYRSKTVQTQRNRYIVGLGSKDFDIRVFGTQSGIRDIHIVSDNYKLVSGKWKQGYSKIKLGTELEIGGNDFTFMAGPCSIESEQQIDEVIQHLVKNNIRIMRGGVYKPRSSPYSFRGLGMEGLSMWSEKAKASGIKIISEVMEVGQIEKMYDFVDIYQVGARNTQNFNLLDELGKVDKPVLIKRGISGSIDELLQSAEYVFSGGNEDLILCERGIRTFETASRNTLDINAIPLLKKKSHLPVIADPSHGIGIRELVTPVALACAAAGADGIIYEVHPLPEKAFSDAQQTLDFEESKELLIKVRAIENCLRTY